MIRSLLRDALSRLRGEPSLGHLQKRGLNVGEDVHVGVGTRIDYSHCHLITIQDEVTIGPDVLLLAHDASLVRRFGIGREAPVTLERGCFVGARAIIMPGVTIGRGAIVGAGAVVTHSVEPGILAHGVPAKPAGTAQGLADRFVTVADP